jgi:hypothetical protein
MQLTAQVTLSREKVTQAESKAALAQQESIRLRDEMKRLETEFQAANARIVALENEDGMGDMRPMSRSSGMQRRMASLTGGMEVRFMTKGGKTP